MQRRIRRFAFLVPAAMLWTALVTSCFDAPSAPRGLTGYLALAPALPSAAATIVDIDHVRVIIARTDDGSVVLDSTVQVQVGSQTVNLALQIPVLRSDDTFFVTLECYTAAGELAFVGGPVEVQAATSTTTTPIEVEIPLSYVGQGYNAAVVEIVTTGASVDFGATVLLTARALDSSGVVIPNTPMSWSSRNAQRASIPDPAVGAVVGGTERGPVEIVVQLLTGPADTTVVQVNPVADDVVPVSGNGQTGLVNGQLPSPLVVQVIAVDGLGVANVSVDFTTPDGGAFSPATVVTDNAGNASTTWTLGPNAGPQTANAGVAAIPGAQATFTAAAVPLTGGVQWASAVNGQWGDAANWLPARVPTSTDTVFITLPGNYTVNVDTDAMAAFLTLGGPTDQQILEIDGTLTVDTAFVVGPSGVLALSGGTLAGDGTIDVLGRFDWNRGTLSGTGLLVVATGGTFNVVGAPLGDDKWLDGRAIENAGTVTWSDTAVVYTGNGATFTNLAGADVNAQRGRLEGSLPGTPMVFQNDGTLLKTGPADITFQVNVNNDGVFDIQEGTMSLSGDGASSGTFTLQSGTRLSVVPLTAYTFTSTSSITGAGQVVFGSTQSIVVEGAFDITGQTSIAGPTVTFDVGAAYTDTLGLVNGSLRGFADVQVRRSFSWAGGSQGGTGTTTIMPAATARISGSSAKSLNTRTLVNRGTLDWLGGGLDALSGGGIVNQSGASFDMQVNANLTGPGAFTNAGTLVKTGTGVGAVFWNVDNTGTFDVQAGILIAEGNFQHQSGGVLRGAGTLDLTNAGTVTVDGAINPGTSPGVLSIMGPLPQGSTSTLNIELNGLVAGIEYDQLIVSGDASMGGALNITTGFSPSVGDQFTVLTYGTESGRFTSVSGLDLGGGLFLDTLWGSGQLDLRVIQPPLAPEIVFAGSDIGTGGQIGIFTVAPDGSGLSNIVPLASLGSGLIHPVWSPNRSRIAYTYQTFGPAATYNELFVISSDGTQSATVVTDTNAAYPRWSPDGRHLAFECRDSFGFDEDVCVIPDVTGSIASLDNIGNDPLNSGTRVVVTDAVVDETTPGTAAFAWHPINPDLIAFVRDSLNPLGGPPVSRIYTANFDGTNVQMLSPPIMDVGNGPLEIYWGMDWEPNGAWIAFDARDPQGGHHIYRIDASGTNLTQLTSGTGEDTGPIVSPPGAPGGLEILFGRNDPPLGTSEAWIVSSTGVERQLTKEDVVDGPTQYYGADWSPNGNEIVITLFQDPLLNPGCNLLIYKVPWDANPSDYRTRATLIGRNTISTCDVLDIQPSWRP